MTELSGEDFSKVRKIFALFDSNQDGEVLSAVRRMQTILQRNGLNFSKWLDNMDGYVEYEVMLDRQSEEINRLRSELASKQEVPSSVPDTLLGDVANKLSDLLATVQQQINPALVMTSDRFVDLCQQVVGDDRGWKTRAGKALGKTPQQIWQYANGKVKIPDDVRDNLLRMAEQEK